MKRGGQHSADTRERLRLRAQAQWATREAREAHGTLTRERMAATAEWHPELRRLRDAGATARRERFLAKVFAPISAGSQTAGKGGARPTEEAAGG